MAFSRAITHPFVSAIADGADATLVRPSNWNAGHTQAISGAVSGGIPYFSSTTSEATSALLAAGGIVLGGGAGNPPATDANLTYSATTFSVGWSGTAVLSATASAITAAQPLLFSADNANDIGASGASRPRAIYAGTSLRVQNGVIDSTITANIIRFAGGSNPSFAITGGAVEMPSNVGLYWNSSVNAIDNTYTTGITRTAAGALAIGTGAAGSFAGSLKLTTLNVNTSVVPVTNGVPTLGAAANGFSALYLDYTNTATVGNVTINKPSGRVNLGAGGTTLTLTNSLITAASRVFLNPDGAPGNVVAVLFYAVTAAGSCTINAVPAITNQTAIDFWVLNAD